jgi:hypothetical protein
LIGNGLIFVAFCPEKVVATQTAATFGAEH